MAVTGSLKCQYFKVNPHLKGIRAKSVKPQYVNIRRKESYALALIDGITDPQGLPVPNIRQG
ncbi:hypothetical protein ACTXT7_002859 [Hymenolepis weldensis]